MMVCKLQFNKYKKVPPMSSHHSETEKGTFLVVLLNRFINGRYRSELENN